MRLAKLFGVEAVSRSVVRRELVDSKLRQMSLPNQIRKEVEDRRVRSRCNSLNIQEELMM